MASPLAARRAALARPPTPAVASLRPDARLEGPDTVGILPSEALGRLAERDGEKCRIVELKFFGGLTNEEAAEVVGRSVATVEREWAFARSWLHKELKG